MRTFFINIIYLPHLTTRILSFYSIFLKGTIKKITKCGSLEGKSSLGFLSSQNPNVA